MSTKGNRRSSKRRRSKYEERIRIDASPEKIAQSIFWRKAPPKDEWDYLKPRKSNT